MNKQIIVKSIAFAGMTALLGGCMEASSEPQPDYGKQVSIAGRYSLYDKGQFIQPCGSGVAYWTILSEDDAARVQALSRQKFREQNYGQLYVEVTGTLHPSDPAQAESMNFMAILKVGKVSKLSKVIPEGCTNPG
ncbi:MAG: hypothetical protein CSA68_09650 [Rhodobacterales bacterium]|nr:MAG: hypothetical protein CSA68_09650 [Rhodobacterales bacterium]